MPTVFLSPVGGAGAQFFDANGDPLSGGKLYTYAAGTTTPAVTYTTFAGNVSQSNPIVLNSAGRVSGSSEIWLVGGTSYKFVLKDGNDVLLATWDNINGINDPSEITYVPDADSLLVGQATNVQQALDKLSNNEDGSSFVGFIQSGAGAVGRSTQSKLRDVVSILDFGADSTGVALCNTALDAAKAVCNTVYFPPGTYRIENYNLQDLRLIGAGGAGPNYGVNTTTIEGSGDIFVDANNFSLSNLTIRNTASGTLGKLIQVKDIDTGIGPITNCQFLRAAYHIYHQSATRTIVGATIQGCLFREATVYSRYYENQGLFQYSEIDCYTQENKRGLFIQSTSTALISASVFEFQDEGAVYVVNTAVFSDVIRGLKFQNIHFEQNGNVTPSPDVTINVTLSMAKVEFDNCGFYASTVAGNVDCTGSSDLRIFEHNCQDASYQVSAGTKITVVNRNVVGGNEGVYTNGASIASIGEPLVSDKGFTASGNIATTISGLATATAVPAPASNQATLVLVRDRTTSGVAVLMMTDTVVTVVSSTLTSITFSIVGGFLAAQTTGGSPTRSLAFNYITT